MRVKLRVVLASGSQHNMTLESSASWPDFRARVLRHAVAGWGAVRLQYQDTEGKLRALHSEQDFSSLAKCYEEGVLHQSHHGAATFRIRVMVTSSLHQGADRAPTSVCETQTSLVRATVGSREHSPATRKKFRSLDARSVPAQLMPQHTSQVEDPLLILCVPCSRSHGLVATPMTPSQHSADVTPALPTPNRAVQRNPACCALLKAHHEVAFAPRSQSMPSLPASTSSADAKSAAHTQAQLHPMPPPTEAPPAALRQPTLEALGTVYMASPVRVITSIASPLATGKELLKEGSPSSPGSLLPAAPSTPSLHSLPQPPLTMQDWDAQLLSSIKHTVTKLHFGSRLGQAMPLEQPKALPSRSAAKESALENSEQEVSKVVFYLTLS
ncbi:hypothetical protein QJQ45_017295, partial [Haematococcus lacustris]